MVNREIQIQKLLGIILENALSRLYIYRLDEGDRNAIYFEFKEWIEDKHNDLEKENIIYCNYIRQIKY